MDLAKLALVTSRDEEDDEADRGCTDSSNDTDATLVEESPCRGAKADLVSSVLGKRSREEQGTSLLMDVDEEPPKTPASDAEPNGYVMVSHPPSPRRSKSPRIASRSSSSFKDAMSTVEEGKDAVQSTEDPPKKPQIPARKPAASSESVMLFGEPILVVNLK